MTEELFDEYLKKNGYNGAYKGRFDDTETYMLDIIKSSYEEMRIEVKFKYPSVHIGVINEPNFNATAFKFKDQYFIGLNIGLLRIVKNFYNYLFSRNDIFVESDASSEVNPNITIDLSSIDNYIDTVGDLFGNIDFENFVPKSLDRKKLSKIYAANAVLYLFFHEYGHIVHGHLDYSIDKNMNFNFVEAVSKENIKGNLIKQTLEMDADSFAAVRSIKVQKDINFLFGGSLITGFSAICIFQLLSTKIDNLDELGNYSHPIPVIRQNIFMSIVYTVFIQLGEKKGIEIANKIRNIIISEYKNIFVDVFGIEKNDLTLMLFNDRKVHLHFLDVMNAWNEVRDDLMKFAYGPIAEKKIWEYDYSDYLE